tara:strand:+ start:247 stop:882 length:636 start_codon:yes stop_codon:yes gene_type:complete
MIIHLIAPKDKNKWPEIWHKCYEYWVNSSYQIKLWDDDQIDSLIKDDDLEFFNIINKLPKICKLDYFRPLVLEKYGGAYFDLDIEIIFDFLSVIDPNKIYIMGHPPFPSKKIKVQNSLFISPIQHSLFFHHLKNYFKYTTKKYSHIINEPYSHIMPGLNIGEIAGSIALSKFVKLYKKQLSFIEILDHKYFNSNNNSINFCIHHSTQSWNN